jgi:uncharacterized membrane protein YesL
LFNLPVVALALLLNTGPFSIAALMILLLIGVLPFGPANAGLYAVAERVTDGRTASWRDFFEGVRKYAKLSWKVYGLWTLGLVLIIVNLQFYQQMEAPIGAFLNILFLYFGLVWFGLLIYIGPLMVIQTDKRIRTIGRNAGLMTFGRPIFTLVTLFLMAVILFASIWLTILAIIATFAFLAVWSFRATLTLIAEGEERRAAQAEKAAPQQPVATGKGRGGQIRPRD